MKLAYRDDRVLLGTICIIFIIAYLLTYPQHAFYSDENSYLGLGRQILEGRYSSGVFDRAPLLPSLVSVSYLLGLDPFQVKFILPLIFGTLFIIVTYLMGRRFCGNGLLPALIILSFPYFWKWQPFLLVDILLGVFAGLSLLFFYRGVEENEKFLLHSGVLLALAMLTKFSAVLLIPAFLFYLLYRKRLGILKSREFLGAFFAFLIILLGVAALTALSSGTLGFNLRFMSLENYFRVPAYYLLNFAMVPWSLVFLYGMYRIIRNRGQDREGVLALIFFFVVFIFFHLLVWKEMRFLLFIIPIFAIIAERGLHGMGRCTKYGIIVIFFALGFLESMLLLNVSTYVTWGADAMTREMLALPPNSTIALDSIYVYNKALEGRTLDMPENATLEWVRKNNPDYIVLSIYGEIGREPRPEYYKPKLGPFDISFMEGTENPKNILTWWPGYEFGSKLYMEVSSEYTAIKTIRFNGQDVFIIYEVS